MAVDTRNKRFSMMGLSQPIPSLYGNPDGTIAAADRAQLLYLYSGLTLGVLVITFVNKGTVFVLAALEATVVRHTSLGAPVLAAVTNAIVQDEQSVFIVREDKRKITAGD